MRNHDLLGISIWFAIVLLLAAPVLTIAADSNTEKEPKTVDDPMIAVEFLEYRLLPLTRDELAIEADGWIRVLQDHLTQISNVQIDASEAEEEEKSRLLEELNALREQQITLTDRTKAVIEEFRKKGGEIEVYEAYVSAVSGPKVDVTDTQATVTAIIGWLKSAEGGIRWATNIVLVIVTLLVFKFLSNILSRATRKAVARFKGTSDLLKDFLVNVVSKLTLLIGIIVALSMLEVNIGPFLAAIGAAGFIIGFALQGTLSNFASGIMILLYRPYDIGDFVKVGGTSGSVEAMTLVSTTLKQPDNQVVIIPNNSIWGDIITNVTGSATRRVDMIFGIGYDDDFAKAQSVLEDIVAKHPLVLDQPEPVVRMHELADSSVNFVVRPWAKTSDYFAVYWDVTRAVKERFDAEGISIPYPQRDVHLHQAAVV